MTAEFQRQLDRAIMTGGSSAKVARELGINCVTVRRRRSILASEGILPKAQRIGREDSNETNNR